MKSAKHSIKAPAPDTADGTPRRVALKIQRRRYGHDALTEIGIHHFLRREKGACPDLVGFQEAFFHDGHICTAYELHGRSLDTFVDRGALPLEEVKIITRQLLGGLVRMHEAGFAHTDVKPLNILHRRNPRPRAKLSDLGNADNVLRLGSNRCTRDYTPPEVLLGNPLDVRLDLWSLACTVFELATGRVLFDPHAAAEKKYAEFNEDIPEESFDPSVGIDDAEEKAEQYVSGTVLSGKYRLESRLGQGKFATVWRAVVLHDTPLEGGYETLLARANAEAASRKAARPDPDPNAPPEDPARAWRKARGARDLHDFILNCEHLALIQELIGPPPPAWAARGLYAQAYCDAAGRLKHDPHPGKTISLEMRLRRRKLRAADARGLAEFLSPLLRWNPDDRPTAAACLTHPWLHAKPAGKKLAASRPQRTARTISPLTVKLESSGGHPPGAD